MDLMTVAKTFIDANDRRSLFLFLLSYFGEKYQLSSCTLIFTEIQRYYIK